MKEEIKDLWVAALNSGEYKQGTLWLRNNDKFCCLGVLCDLAVKAGVTTQEPLSPTNPQVVMYGGTHTGALPANVVKWAGIQADQRVPSLNRAFSILNDQDGLDFQQIADIIEGHWEEI